MSLLLTLGLGGGATPPTPPTGGDTPYMNLLLPTVSVTLGPLYATEVNNAFLRVDGHDHSDGYGKLVGSNGLNINAPLSFHGNDLTNANSVGFNIQSPSAGLVGSIYMSGEDLYVVDGSGFAIQLTASHAVNVAGLGSWTGLSAPAVASYNSVTKTFALQSDGGSNLYGKLATGDILLHLADPGAGSAPYTRLAAAGVATYTMTLPDNVPAAATSQLLQMNSAGKVSLTPALPSAGSWFMRMNSTGSVAADVTVDTGTMQLASVTGGSSLGVKPLGINTPQLATGAVTAEKMAVPVCISAAVNFFGTDVHTAVIQGSFQTSSVFFGKNARPILVCFGPTPGGGGGVSGGSDLVTYNVKVDGSVAAPAGTSFQVDYTGSAVTQDNTAFFSYIIPPGTIFATGNHTFQFQATSAAGIGVAGTFSVTEL